VGLTETEKIFEVFPLFIIGTVNWVKILKYWIIPLLNDDDHMDKYTQEDKAVDHCWGMDWNLAVQIGYWQKTIVYSSRQAA
jgi:hypothetical protein